MRSADNPERVRRHFNDLARYLPIHQAIARGNLPQLISLVSKSAYDINECDETCGTPIHVCIRMNNLPAFLHLALHGADVNALDKGATRHLSDSPIRLAVRLGRRGFVRALWDMGVDRERREPDDEMTLLQVAADENRVDVLRDLLDWSEDEWVLVDKPRHQENDAGSRTANPETPGSGLQHGNIVEPNKDREEALMLAAGAWYPDIVSVLLQRCEYTQMQLRRAIFLVACSKPEFEGYGSTWDGSRISDGSLRGASLVEILLDTDMGVKDGICALGERIEVVHELCRSTLCGMMGPIPHKNGILKLLLSRGADPNWQGPDGRTSMHNAIAGNRSLGRYFEEVAVLLLENGARMDIADNSGNTASDLLGKHINEGLAEKLLLRSSQIQKELPIR
ncbi:unnamed protein product [Periconia digitata]|uniref:Ankyrin n=1 Tax=Periconia digitata TaxID=1303443 RepID=A0A9W4UNT7_9PLEO|nr:unnamed protein product [Periconia digitata]